MFASGVMMVLRLHDCECYIYIVDPRSRLFPADGFLLGGKKERALLVVPTAVKLGSGLTMLSSVHTKPSLLLQSIRALDKRPTKSFLLKCPRFSVRAEPCSVAE